MSSMADGTTAEDLRARLHEQGLRLTPQRRLVLDAVTRLRHATPEAVSAEVRRTDPGLNASTVYRTLELLERLGLVRHTHLGSGPATYHAGDDAGHLHLVCEGCGRVEEADVALAADLVGRLHAVSGFEPDVGHMAISGRCRECAGQPR
jgi:Fur family ferric uptake transcriptional regulator